MRESYLAVAGVVATDPTVRTFDDGRQVMSFRVASTSRRYDNGTKSWVDGQTLWVKVSCWRELAVNAAQCIRKRDRIVAWGKIKSEQWKTKDGGLRSDLALEAEAMGHDLTFGVAAFDRRRRTVSARVLTDDPNVNIATGEIVDEEAEAVVARASALLGEEAAQSSAPHADGGAASGADDGVDEADDVDGELRDDLDAELDGELDEEGAGHGELENEVRLGVPA
jgi:single-strand DNA-binding protein